MSLKTFSQKAFTLLAKSIGTPVLLSDNAQFLPENLAINNGLV